MTLETCYQLVSKMYGDNPEPWSVVQSVDAHRRHWRPERVHTVLLAESHVYTRESECVKMKSHSFIEPNDTTSLFVRFVYCLGYGESDFVGSDLSLNEGTYQFWKLLSSSIEPPSENSFAPFLKTRNRNFAKRMEAKYRLLNQLKEDGVWLMDASILALYGPGKCKPRPAIRKKIIESCWDEYIHRQILEVNPHSIIVVGKGVNDVLQNQLAKLRPGIDVNCVPQPQGCRTTKRIEEMHQAVFTLCQNARSNAKNRIRADVS
jgi:hypothetical protein